MCRIGTRSCDRKNTWNKTRGKDKNEKCYCKECKIISKLVVFQTPLFKVKKKVQIITVIEDKSDKVLFVNLKINKD